MRDTVGETYFKNSIQIYCRSCVLDCISFSSLFLKWAKSDAVVNRPAEGTTGLFIKPCGVSSSPWAISQSHEYILVLHHTKQHCYKAEQLNTKGQL